MLSPPGKERGLPQTQVPGAAISARVWAQRPACDSLPVASGVCFGGTQGAADGRPVGSALCSHGERLLPPGPESVLSSCSPGVSGVLGWGFRNLDLVRRGEPAHLWKCICVPPVDLTSFVTHFEWDMAKYPAKQPLVGVVDTLAKVREGPALGGRSHS